MPLYRKILIIVSNNLFRLLLFFSISTVAASIIYSDRAYIPVVLEKNNAYERVVTALLETNKEQSLTVGGDVTLEDPEIQRIIKEAFPANELENYTKSVIESAYSWLNQESSEFKFVIDLSENKNRLTSGLSDFAIGRLQSLEYCTNSVTEIEPFSATCQPRFIDYELERQNIKQQLDNESGFINDPIITQNSIIPDSSEIPFNEQYRDLPTYYSLAVSSPVYLILLLSILALIVIFASSTRKKGYKKIGYGLTMTSSSLIFFTILFGYVLPSFTGSLPIFQSSGQGIDALLNEVTIDFGKDFSWMIIKLSTPLLIVGIVLIIYSKIGLNRKDYKSAKLKSGVVSSNEQKNKNSTKSSKPPIQSSESSDTKPKRKLKNKKYRKIPKKEL